MNIFCVFASVLLIFGYMTVKSSKHIIHQRISNGKTDQDHLYPYIVILANKPPHSRDPRKRSSCTGNVITEFWVLTAAHCVFPGPPKVVAKYRNYTLYLNHSKSEHIFSKVIKSFPHPEFVQERHPFLIKNDIAVICIESFPLKIYARLLTTPVKSLIGNEITFAGYGKTDPWWKLKNESKYGAPASELQLGYGTVVKCPRHAIIPQVCVMPHLPKNFDLTGIQTTRPGDSGGPILYNDGVVAILSGHYYGKNSPISTFTPVRRYFQWIMDIANASINIFPIDNKQKKITKSMENEDRRNTVDKKNRN